MARASVRTLLPLDTFTKRVSYSPILFNQVYVPAQDDGDDRQRAIACSDPLLQYTWQPLGGGKPGREEIAEAIAQAEEMITSFLGFSPVPTWVVDERVNSRPGGPEGYYTPYQLTARTARKHIIQGGIEAWSTIDLDAPITYSDVDGDGYSEKATVSVTTTVTDVNDIAVYFPGENHNPDWEIRPIRVSIASGVATITFDRHQCVKPELQEALTAAGVDGLTNANFLTTVDVYRHYNSASQMAVVEWQPSICDDDACMVSAAAGCFSAIDHRNGLVNVHAGTWDADTELWSHDCCSWWQRPSSMRLSYRAGYRSNHRARPMHDMDPALERAITFLALTFMDRDWQWCEPMRNLQAHWTADLAQRDSTPAKATSFQLSRAVLENPLGTTRAAVYAWRVVQPLIVGEAVLGR